MIDRMIALALFAVAGAGAACAASNEKPCLDNSGLGAGPTCAALALKAVHERQLAALGKANGVLFDADSWHPNRSAGDIGAAIGVLAKTAALVERARPRKDLGVTDFIPDALNWLRRDFHLRGWPEPADLGSGFRFLQNRLAQASPQDRKAIVTAALHSGGAMAQSYGPWIEQMVLWRSQEEREDRLKAKAAAREEALKKSFYAERVIARFTGSRRFERTAPGLLSFLIEAAILAAAIGFLSAWEAAKHGDGPAGAVRNFLITTSATLGSGVALFMLFAFTGDPGGVGLLLWLGGFVVMALPIARGVRRLLPDQRRIIHGSARWSEFKDMLACGRARPKGRPPQGFALGRALDASSRCDPRLFYQGHVLTVAPTGAGKGVGAVIPNLLDYQGSAFVLDVKGENYAVTARARAEMGQEICLLDPFGVTGAAGQAFNWLDAIDLDSPDCVSASASLADMLVIPSEGEADSVHFDDTARDLLRGLLLFMATLPPRRRHLGELRRLITLPMTGPEEDSETLVGVLAEMAASGAAFGVIARAANCFMAKPEKERGSVLSTVQRHTAFLDDPRIVMSLARSDFTLSDLKTKPKTVYVALPPRAIAANSRFLRGCIGLALTAVTASSARAEPPVAFILDEFAQLGRMTAVEDALALARGYGAAFWIFVQDLSQLKAVYPKWRSFLANAAQQFFGVADYETASYVSSMLGQRTVEFRTTGSTSQVLKPGQGSASASQHFAPRSLLTPDEVMAYRAAIVFIAGERPYRLARLNYLSDPGYAASADPNPYYA